MKSKRTRNKLVLTLNKRSIANLNQSEMYRARGRGEDESEGFQMVQETDPEVCEMSATPVPTDFGIPTRSG